VASEGSSRYASPMHDQSRFTFWFEGGSDLGQFGAMVSANGFSGETGYVVFAGQIKSFLDALTDFPIVKRVALTIGEEFEDGPLLALTIEPDDQRGTLRAGVILKAYDDRAFSVSTSFLCVYSDIERFAGELRGSLHSGGTATLTADPN